MKKYNDKKELQYKKNKIKSREEIISKSQIKQNNLETKIKKLKTRKENIINKKTNLLGKIFSYLIYDIIMISLLILFIIFFINRLMLITSIKLIIYIIEMYVGVAIISVTGAIIFSKIEIYLREYLYKKRTNKINELIKIKEENLQFEINIQEQLKHDITNIMNNNEENHKKNSNTENQYHNIIDNNNTNLHKKRIRKL